MKSSLRTKMTVTFLMIILISCSIVSFISYSSSIRLVEDAISQIAETVIKNAANVIDIEKYEQITPESGETDYYYQLREQLNEVRETAGVSYLYTMTRKKVNDTYEYYYMVDGLPIGDENESLLGDQEEEMDLYPKIVQTFEQESMQVEMSYSEEWGGMVSAYVPLKSKSGEVIGILGADIDVTNVYQTMESNKKIFISTILIILVISSVVIFFFVYYLLKPLKNLTSQVEKVGEGNLTSQIDISRTDEIGYLANAINSMQQNLRDMIYNILQTAESVSSQSVELTQSSHEVNQANLQIATTMEVLASGMDNQANSLNKLSSEMDSFSVKIKEANNYGKDISLDSTEILGFAMEGNRLMDTSMKQMDLIHGTVKDAVNRVQDLSQKTDEISSLVHVIKSIADQTNLLALNASIEAARAGEHGKGFAVVAGEVRKLANQVNNSVQDITGIVENIQFDSKTMVQSLVEGYAQVQEGSNQIQLTGEAFNKISFSITSVVDRIEIISKNLGHISQTSLLINDSIEQIASISEEVVAGVEQTTASIEETNSSMEEISVSADYLAQIAKSLNDKVKTFKIE